MFGRTVHFRLLAPVILAIELPLDLARILTLAVRLLANMFADHTVIAVWISLVPIGVPAIFMGLGLIVSRFGARGAPLEGTRQRATLSKETTVIRKFGKVVLWSLFLIALPMVAGAEDGSGGDGKWGYALGAGLAIGLAGLGCGIGQGLTAGNTTAGIARNPGASGTMFTSFILGMVLIESIAIYGLVIAFMLQGKI
jgi:F-type H+-transporting ATPase subunit c